MKKFLLILTTYLLLSPTIIYGMTNIICGGGTNSASEPSYNCTDATHDSANTAITLCEDMEGSADCDAGAGEQLFCRNSWTTVSNTVFNYSPSLQGNYSADFDGSVTAAYIRKTISATDNCYMFLKIKVDALPTGAGKYIIYFSNTGSAKGRVILNTTGTLKIENGTVNATTTGALSAGSTYYIWAGYTKGTGTDGTGYVAFSATTTKPTSGDNYASVSTGDANAQINQIGIGLSTTAADLRYKVDQIRVNSSDFGDNPQ